MLGSTSVTAGILFGLLLSNLAQAKNQQQLQPVTEDQMEPNLQEFLVSNGLTKHKRNIVEIKSFDEDGNPEEGLFRFGFIEKANKSKQAALDEQDVHDYDVNDDHDYSDEYDDGDNANADSNVYEETQSDSIISTDDTVVSPNTYNEKLVTVYITKTLPPITVTNYITVVETETATTTVTKKLRPTQIVISTSGATETVVSTVHNVITITDTNGANDAVSYRTSRVKTSSITSATQSNKKEQDHGKAVETKFDDFESSNTRTRKPGSPISYVSTTDGSYAILPVDTTGSAHYGIHKSFSNSTTNSMFDFEYANDATTTPEAKHTRVYLTTINGTEILTTSTSYKSALSTTGAGFATKNDTVNGYKNGSDYGFDVWEHGQDGTESKYGFPTTIPLEVSSGGSSNLNLGGDLMSVCFIACLTVLISGLFVL
ncbi:unnamed protein product [Ambrosiozyma monospora]|uniref:Unnamed protein product n=1 Tax=Ambrosiozyma monospora TaxID=43982 RepID=A0A9W7DFQ2_AMBMO|nr:unnamed protein product [Ambrosiozyma monospora]